MSTDERLARLEQMVVLQADQIDELERRLKDQAGLMEIALKMTVDQR